MKKCLLYIGLLLGGFSIFHSGAQAADLILEVWDDITWDVESGIIDTQIQDFETQHNCQVERTTRPLEDTKAAVMTAVRSGKGADVLLSNNGETMMGPLVRGGYLLPLDTYAEQYGWTERLFSPDLLTRNRYTADGKELEISQRLWNFKPVSDYFRRSFCVDLVNSF
ncbi:MAG: extracellular solute-binding protein [Candidatus Vecturithrix sp.]|jgi:raffinose/stachyose/melibiose transport system substrate-binding protein|nr:extracellular solute-binding protein [Candidatus Vecturithrix sp.]